MDTNKGLWEWMKRPFRFCLLIATGLLGRLLGGLILEYFLTERPTLVNLRIVDVNISISMRRIGLQE